MSRENGNRPGEGAAHFVGEFFRRGSYPSLASHATADRSDSDQRAAPSRPGRSVGAHGQH